MDARATDFSQRVIIIRSDRCTVANECRASFVLPVPIVIPTGSVAMIQFIKLTFPLSMYLINQYNDSLTIAGTTHTRIVENHTRKTHSKDTIEFMTS